MKSRAMSADGTSWYLRSPSAPLGGLDAIHRVWGLNCAQSSKLQRFQW
jgi:hypothetical protein